MSELSLEEMEAMLPTKPRKAGHNPLSLVYLGISVPKWGKTTFFCDFPGAVLLAFERGFQFQQCPTIFIDKWHDPKFEPYVDSDEVMHMTMMQASKVLEASDKYKFLVYDTADMAAKKCSDYYLEKYKWQHAQDGGDFGRGYDIAQNTPFRQSVGRMMATGRGIAFTTHQAINEHKTKSGFAKKETTLPGGIYKFLHTQADIILHGSFGARQKGNKYRDRIWQTEGDEEVLAGNRARGLYLPAKYIVDPERPYEQWAEFFANPEIAAEADISAVREDRDAERERPLKRQSKPSATARR